jgi:hypothetical protein
VTQVASAVLFCLGALPRRKYLVLQSWTRTLSPSWFWVFSGLSSFAFHPLVFAAPIVGRMGFLTLRQLAVTAGWSGGNDSFLWAFLMQVAAPAPQTLWRLSTVCPNMPELLAVMALCKADSSSVGLHRDCYMAKGCQTKHFLRLSRSWQGDEEKGEVPW